MEVTTRYGKAYRAPASGSGYYGPSSGCFLPFELRHTVCSQEATYQWTRERRRARDAAARFTRGAASRDWAALSQCLCAGSAGTRNLRQAVGRDLSIGTRPKAKEAASHARHPRGSDRVR